MHPLAAGNRIKTLLILAAGLAGVILFAPLLPSVLGMLSGACLIAFLLTPVAAFLEKKLSRPLACLLAVLLAVGLLLLAVGALLPLVLRQLTSLSRLLPDALARLQQTGEALTRRIGSCLPALTLPQLQPEALQGNLGALARRTVDYAGSLVGGAYRLVLTIILGYFLMAERENALLRLELLIPSPWRCTAVRMGNSLSRELRLYLRGQATIALAVGLLAGAALSLLGLQAAPLLGLIVGLFNVIPYFGPFLGGIPAVLMALSISWQRAGLAVLALLLVQQIDGLVLSPRIMGSITGFSPAVVLVALFLGQQAGGIRGMLLAMPLLMGSRTVYRVFVQRHENN